MTHPTRPIARENTSETTTLDHAASLTKTLQDRFLKAIAKGSLVGFIDGEGRAAGARTQIGTVAAGTVSIPALHGTAIRLFAMARLAEGRDTLSAHGPLLREGARLAAAMVALLPNTEETRWQKQAILEAIRHDGREREASLLIGLLDVSLSVPDGVTVMPMAGSAQSPHDEDADVFVRRMLSQAIAAHRCLATGHEGTATMLAHRTIGEVLAFHAGPATTLEALADRKQLRAVVAGLFDAGLCPNTNALAMLDAALEREFARIASLEGDDPDNHLGPQVH